MAAAGLRVRRSHRAFPEINCLFQLGIRLSRWHPGAADGAGMAAQLRNRHIIDGDAHIVNPGTPGSRDFPSRRDQAIAELARPDKGNIALRRDRALVMGIAGKGEGRIRQREIKPPWAMPWPLTMCGLIVIVSVAWPGLICRISMPRPLLASSSFHIASAQARARSSGESVALTFIADSPRASACRSGSDTKYSPRSPGIPGQFAFEIAWKTGNTDDNGSQRGPPVAVRRVAKAACKSDPASLAPVGRAAHAVARRERGADRGQGGGGQSVRREGCHRPDALRGISAHARPRLCRHRGRWPGDWIGREVFGSSGDLGIRRDGTHATHLAVEADAMVEKPKTLSWDEAAGIGVPFVTAMEGFRRAGMPNKDETVLVMGVNGKVGQAAVQIASWNGARVIGVVRKNEPYEGHANSKVEVIDASTADVATRVRELTGGKGADIVFNTVGDPYFQAAHKSLAVRGRQILIAAIDRIVQFNILEFYRGQHTYVGIDTLGLSSIATGAVLRELGPGFASGHLKPFPIKPVRSIRWNTPKLPLSRSPARRAIA
jgi:hypothetical protein